MNLPVPNQELLARRKAAVAEYMAAYVALYEAQERALKEARRGYENAHSWEEMRRFEKLQEGMDAALGVFVGALRKGNGSGGLLPLPRMSLLKKDQALATAYAVAKKSLEEVNEAIEADENTRKYLKALDSWAD